MTRSENFILDFTHIYIDENIEQTENIVRIDCSDILETDLYCTKEGEAEIQKRIENFMEKYQPPFTITNEISG